MMNDEFKTDAKIHNLKLWRGVFNDVVVEGKKRFQVRKNDRNFNVGDLCVFWEVNNEGLETGKKSKPFIIDYILKDTQYPDGLIDGYCVFSIEPIGWYQLDHGDIANE